MADKNNSFLVRLEEVEKSKLEKLSQASGLSQAAVVRLLIRRAKLKDFGIVENNEQV